MSGAATRMGLVLIHEYTRADLVGNGTDARNNESTGFLSMRTFHLDQFHFFRHGRRNFRIFFRFIDIGVRFAGNNISSTIFIIAVAGLAHFDILGHFDGIQHCNACFQIQRRTAQARGLTRLTGGTRYVQKDGGGIGIRFTFLGLFDRVFRACRLDTYDFDDFDIYTLNGCNCTGKATDAIQRCDYTACILIEFAHISTRIGNGICTFCRLDNDRFFRRESDFISIMLFDHVGFLASRARTLNRFDRFLILRCRTRKAYDAFSKTDRHFGINADRINDFNLHSFLRLDTKGFARFIFIQLAEAELSTDHFLR